MGASIREDVQGLPIGAWYVFIHVSSATSTNYFDSVIGRCRARLLPLRSNCHTTPLVARRQTHPNDSPPQQLVQHAGFDIGGGV